MTDEELDQYRWPETARKLRHETMNCLYAAVDTTTLPLRLRDELANAMQGVNPNRDSVDDLLYVVSQVLGSTVRDLYELKHQVERLERKVQELEYQVDD